MISPQAPRESKRVEKLQLTIAQLELELNHLEALEKEFPEKYHENKKKLSRMPNASTWSKFAQIEQEFRQNSDEDIKRVREKLKKDLIDAIILGHPQVSSNREKLEKEINESYKRYSEAEIALEESLNTEQKKQLNKIKLLRLQLAHEKTILASEMANQKAIQDFEVGNDIAGFAANILNQTRKILAALQQTIVTFAQIVAPLNLILNAFGSFWDSIKVLLSKVESTQGKATKVIINSAIIAFTVAAIFAAPITALVLGFAALMTSFVKDALYPWMKARDDLKAYEKEYKQKQELVKKLENGEEYLKNIQLAKEKLALLQQDLSKVKEQLQAHAKSDLSLKKSDEVSPIKLTQEEVSRLADQLVKKSEVRRLLDEIKVLTDYIGIAGSYEKNHKKLAENEYSKRLFMINNIATIVGVVLCAIPFPPTIILGAAILMATAVVGIVRRYNLWTKLKDFLSGNSQKEKTNLTQQQDVQNRPEEVSALAATQSLGAEHLHNAPSSTHSMPHSQSKSSAELEVKDTGLTAHNHHHDHHVHIHPIVLPPAASVRRSDSVASPRGPSPTLDDKQEEEKTIDSPLLKSPSGSKDEGRPVSSSDSSSDEEQDSPSTPPGHLLSPGHPVSSDHHQHSQQNPALLLSPSSPGLFHEPLHGVESAIVHQPNQPKVEKDSAPAAEAVEPESDLKKKVPLDDPHADPHL